MRINWEQFKIYKVGNCSLNKRLTWLNLSLNKVEWLRNRIGYEII